MSYHKTQLSAESQRIFDKMDREGRTSLTFTELSRVKEIERQLSPGRRTSPDWNEFSGDSGDPTKGFTSHRDFLGAVMRSSITGSLDDRLGNCQSLAAGSDEHSGASDPYGGFLLPTAFAPDVLATMAGVDPIAGLVTRLPMESGTVAIPARVDKDHSTSVSGGLRVYRRAETDSVTESRMEMEQVKLVATSLFGVAYASEELLARSPSSFLVTLEAGFRDEFTATLMDERLNGTGAGQFEGVINSPCVVEVDKESGQAASTIEKENIDKMVARCWRYSDAVWLANHDTRPQLKSLVQAVGTGGSAVPYFTSENGQEMLDGRPIFFTEFCPTLGTAGDLLLGDWSQYLEGSLGNGVQVADSVHVRFVNHERTFKFWLENDGRCWWRSPLTPRNGSDTLSPFVKLETRA